MLSVIMLIVIMLSVVMLNVLALHFRNDVSKNVIICKYAHYAECHLVNVIYTECHL
jgi:hypothetical protein